MTKSKNNQSRRGVRPAGAAAVLALIASGWGAVALASEAKATTQSYKIPAGPVASALNRLADASGAQVIYDSELTRSRTTRGVKGRRTLSGALDKVLACTGLEYRLTPDGKAVTIQLAKAATGTASDANPVTLPTIDVEGKDGGLGGRFTGYSPDMNKPAAASKTNIPLLQTPTTIQVVPREVLDDQQDISVKDSLTSNVSSVVVGSQFYDRFIIRGFDVSANTYRNSSRQLFITNLETANLQAIEVVKGPAAMLYGRIEPGGLINLVTKRPLLSPYYSVQEQFGSFGLTRTTVDATGPLTADKSLAYRVNLAYLNTDSFRDFVTRENVFVAPTKAYPLGSGATKYGDRGGQPV